MEVSINVSTVLIPHVIAVAVAVAHCRYYGGLILTWRCGAPNILLLGGIPASLPTTFINIFSSIISTRHLLLYTAIISL